LHELFDRHSAQNEQLQVVRNVVVNIRMPRIVTAMLVGASLSVSGAAYQSMFINPLVSPGMLGVLSGASFGAALGMILSAGWLTVQICAFGFGVLAVLIAVGIAKLYKGDKLLMLILGGVISSSLFTSLLSVIKYTADPYNQLPAIIYWLHGLLLHVRQHNDPVHILPDGRRHYRHNDSLGLSQHSEHGR
jgi:iron complex transport system permease protein